MPVDLSGLITESVVWLNTKTIDVPTAMQLGGWLAAKVNTLQGLKGPEKQVVVCRVVEMVVERQVPAGPERDGLLAALKVALPAALTLAVDAARGKLSLKKVRPSCVARYLLCFARAAVDVAAAAKLVDAATEKKIEAGLDKVEGMAAPVLADKKEESPEPAKEGSENPEKTEKEPESAPATSPEVETAKEEVRVDFQ